MPETVPLLKLDTVIGASALDIKTAAAMNELKGVTPIAPIVDSDLLIVRSFAGPLDDLRTVFPRPVFDVEAEIRTRTADFEEPAADVMEAPELISQTAVAIPLLDLAGRIECEGVDVHAFSRGFDVDRDAVAEMRGHWIKEFQASNVTVAEPDPVVRPAVIHDGIRIVRTDVDIVAASGKLAARISAGGGIRSFVLMP